MKSLFGEIMKMKVFEAVFLVDLSSNYFNNFGLIYGI